MKKVSTDRFQNAAYSDATGIYVRAQDSDGNWHSVDIAELDEPSLTEFLLSRGGSNPWAENVVRLLLGWPQK